MPPFPIWLTIWMFGKLRTSSNSWTVGMAGRDGADAEIAAAFFTASVALHLGQISPSVPSGNGVPHDRHSADAMSPFLP
jgi:hypothetical protein